MTVGDALFFREIRFAIDYGIADRLLRPWLWHRRTVAAVLATRVPVVWRAKW